MHSLRLSLALVLVCLVLYLVSSRFDSSRHIRCKRVIQKLLLPMSSSLFVLLLLFGRCNIDKQPIYGRTDSRQTCIIIITMRASSSAINIIKNEKMLLIEF